jgi:hypothetical protein
MTNKYNNWERLERVLEYAKMNANAFALHIGMQRSENIYHIKRGAFGISEELAERITSCFPEINPTWLLSGVGDMLLANTSDKSVVPFYEQGIEQFLDEGVKHSRLGKYQLPYSCDCDAVVRIKTHTMSLPGTAATDLFLKRIQVEEMVQGNEYLIAHGHSAIWRKIRCVKSNPEQWRLVAYDRVEEPDIFINKSDIRSVWRVIARMAILVS